MPDLAEIQDCMTAAIFKGDASAIATELVGGGADPVRRFGIYRNNTLISLTNHLKAVFPATARLGDERFFAYAANAFIHREPPRAPNLAVYGGAFPRFLAQFPASRGTPILGEMAALEWAVHSALTAPDLDALPLCALKGDVRDLTLQPSLRFAVSHWRLLDLWAGQGNAAQSLQRRTTRVAVMRQGDYVRAFALDAARYAFWRSLARHFPLELATARALARDPLFDLISELLVLFRAGLVTSISTPHTLH